jgi:RNA processing factor Prp31
MGDKQVTINKKTKLKAKKLGVNLTVNRNGKCVKKNKMVLEKQILSAMKAKKMTNRTTLSKQKNNLQNFGSANIIDRLVNIVFNPARTLNNISNSLDKKQLDYKNFRYSLTQRVLLVVQLVEIIDDLKKKLKNPRYEEYTIVINNTLDKAEGILKAVNGTNYNPRLI